MADSADFDMDKYMEKEGIVVKPPKASFADRHPDIANYLDFAGTVLGTLNAPAEYAASFLPDKQIPWRGMPDPITGKADTGSVGLRSIGEFGANLALGEGAGALGRGLGGVISGVKSEALPLMARLGESPLVTGGSAGEGTLGQQIFKATTTKPDVTSIPQIIRKTEPNAVYGESTFGRMKNQFMSRISDKEYSDVGNILNRYPDAAHPEKKIIQGYLDNTKNIKTTGDLLGQYNDWLLNAPKSDLRIPLDNFYKNKVSQVYERLGTDLKDPTLAKAVQRVAEVVESRAKNINTLKNLHGEKPITTALENGDFSSISAPGSMSRYNYDPNGLIPKGSFDELLGSNLHTLKNGGVKVDVEGLFNDWNKLKTSTQKQLLEDPIVEKLMSEKGLMKNALDLQNKAGDLVIGKTGELKGFMKPSIESTKDITMSSILGALTGYGIGGHTAHGAMGGVIGGLGLPALRSLRNPAMGYFLYKNFPITARTLGVGSAAYSAARDKTETPQDTVSTIPNLFENEK